MSDNELGIKNRGGHGDGSLDKVNTGHASLKTRVGVPNHHIKG